MGHWYGIEKYPNFFAKGSCNTAEYKLEPDGVVAVNNSEVSCQSALVFVDMDDFNFVVFVVVVIFIVVAIVIVFWF